MDRFEELRAEADQLWAEEFMGNQTPAIRKRLAEILRETRAIEEEVRQQKEEAKARLEAVRRKLRRLERNKEN